MDMATFNALLEARICKTREVLAAKSAEYSTGADKLHNFKSDCGGLKTIETPGQVLWGYLRKHLQSIYDMVVSNHPVSQERVDEKIGDAVNYLILLEAIFTEKLERDKAIECATTVPERHDT
jgi:hypothetical protein